MTDFSKFHLAENARIITSSIPGPKSKRLLDVQSRIEGSIVSYPIATPLAIKRAKGAIVEDLDGNQFIDFFSFAGVVNLGHCNEEVAAYTSRQQEELIHALDFPTENKIEAIQKIMNLLPVKMRDEYTINFVGPTGSDAIEAAVKLAKIATGRSGLVAFTGAYHGMTTTALSLTADISLKSKFHLGSEQVHFVPYSYCYRCVVGKTPDQCAMECLDSLTQLLENRYSGVPKPAAIVVEPIQGEGGSIPPHNGFLERITHLANRHGVLTIFDEIQSGFFRTGEFLSFMSSEATPDIITISKGLGGLGYPIAAILYKKSLAVWEPGDHIGTFRGNQVSLAGARGAIDFIHKYKLPEHIGRLSKVLMKGLYELQESYPFIGDVRGRGMMVGIEFVQSKASKLPAADITTAVRDASFQRGLILEIGGHADNVLRILPPLICTEQIIENGLKILGSALESVANNRAEKASTGLEPSLIH